MTQVISTGVNAGWNKRNLILSLHGYVGPQIHAAPGLVQKVCSGWRFPTPRVLGQVRSDELHHGRL